MPAGVELTASGRALSLSMKRQISSPALLACIAIFALTFSGCSTISSRIENNPTAFSQLSPSDQQLVRQGQIRTNMSQEAVYLAWGQPQQKAMGVVRGVSTETWVYTVTTAAYGPGFYGYGPYYGPGYFGRVGFYGYRGHHRFYGAFIDPLWDPYYYPFPATVSYPVKTVSFQNGRVVAYQFLTPSSY